MSYIDKVKHEVLGEIFNLPIYRVSENLTGEEFQATPENLVIGGGSGEHPGLVIKDMKTCVLYYLEFLDEDFTESWYCKNYNENFSNWPNYSNNLEYSWPMKDVANFAQAINNYFEYVVGYTKEKNLNPEHMLHVAMGSFLLYHHPELLPENFQEWLGEVNTSDFNHYDVRAIESMVKKPQSKLKIK